jgi:hypothetical protein
MYQYPVDVNPDSELASGVDLLDNLLPLDDDGRWDIQTYRQALGLLGLYSLLSVGQFKGTLSMHWLVHSWLFDRLPQISRLAYLRVSAATMASSVRETTDSANYLYQRILLPHITALLELTNNNDVDLFQSIDDMKQIAWVMSNAGRWIDVIRLRRKQLKTTIKLLGECH